MEGAVGGLGVDAVRRGAGGGVEGGCAVSVDDVGHDLAEGGDASGDDDDVDFVRVPKKEGFCVPWFWC